MRPPAVYDIPLNAAEIAVLRDVVHNAIMDADSNERRQHLADVLSLLDYTAARSAIKSSGHELLRKQ